MDVSRVVGEVVVRRPARNAAGNSAGKLPGGRTGPVTDPSRLGHAGAPRAGRARAGLTGPR